MHNSATLRLSNPTLRLSKDFGSNYILVSP